MRTKTILSKTKLLGKYRKMDGGGPFDPDNGKMLGNYSDQTATINPSAVSTGSGFMPSTGLVNGVASIGSDVIGSISPTDNYGVTSNGAAIGKGALKDAAAGFMVAGPVGAAAGAVIGGVTGLLGNKKAQKAKGVAIKSQAEQEQQMRDARSGAMIAANPNIKYGNLSASYYAMGGTMKGTVPQVPRLKKPMTAVQPAQRIMPSVADVPGRQLSRLGKGGNMPPAYNQSKLSKPYRPYLPHVPNPVSSKMEDGGTVTKLGNLRGHLYKTSDPSYAHPELVMGANGGDIKRLSATNAKVEGPSHANGGVKLPGAGVELEGDETLNGDFVFSKKLGFAQQHEKIANAMGRVEKKPDTVVNRNTAKALDRQTQLLKVYQEATKQKMGLPNEIDNTAAAMQSNQQGGTAVPSTGSLKNGGKLPKYATGGTTGPGVKTPLPVITQTGDLPANNDPYWKSHPLMTQHDPTIDESTPWGYKPKNLSVPSTIKGVLQRPDAELPSYKTPVLPSDKSLGQSSTYVTPGTQRVTRTPDAIASSSGRYANGGKLMKKMADGGDPLVGGKSLSTLPYFMRPAPGAPIVDSTSPYTVNSLDNVSGTQFPNQDPLNVNQYQTSAAAPKTTKPSSVYSRTTGRSAKAVTPSQAVIPQGSGMGALGLPALNTNIPPATQQAATAQNGTDAQGPLSSSSGKVSGTGSSGKSNLLNKINAAGDKISPFLPNIAEAFRKLPLPNTPVLESEIAPSLVDYSASKAEAIRQTRGANKAAEESLNTGAAVAATRASNLAQQERAVGQISEAENNTNAGIRNQTNQVNLQVRARNNSLKNEYQRELVERTIKGQDLASQNIASVSEKIQGMNRDSKLYDLEDQKLMLEAMKDTTGASYRGARSIFAKHLSKDDLANLDDHFGKIAAQDAADRADQRKLTQAQIDAANRTSINPLSDKYKNSTQILGRKSTVETAAERKAEKSAQAKKEEVN